MSSFAKIFASMLRSTVWVGQPWHVKLTWITLLMLADADGNVWASVPGLARDAEVTVEQCEQALQLFLAPDKHSRTREFEGRRIVEIDGGWHILNHYKYREMQTRKQALAAKRQREHYAKRAGKAAQPAAAFEAVRADVSSVRADAPNPTLAAEASVYGSKARPPARRGVVSTPNPIGADVSGVRPNASDATGARLDARLGQLAQNALGDDDADSVSADAANAPHTTGGSADVEALIGDLDQGLDRHSQTGEIARRSVRPDATNDFPASASASLSEISGSDLDPDRARARPLPPGVFDAPVLPGPAPLTSQVPEWWPGPNERHRGVHEPLGVDVEHEAAKFRVHHFAAPFPATPEGVDNRFEAWLLKARTLGETDRGKALRRRPVNGVAQLQPDEGRTGFESLDAPPPEPERPRRAARK